MSHSVKDLIGRYLNASYAFFLCLALTLGATYFAYRSSHIENIGRFERTVSNIQNTLRNRMTVYTNAILVTRNLFDVKGQVTQQDFHYFVHGMKLQENFPGIQTMGYVERMPRAQAARVLKRMGKTFQSSGTLKDATEVDMVVYFEQLAEKGIPIIGMDLSSSPIRKQALDTARDLGVPVATDRVQPITSPSSSPTAFLVVLPRYRVGLPVTTVEERRKALVGFVYAGFRAQNLFGRISNDVRMQNANLGVRIYDGLGTEPSQLMYSEGEFNNSDEDMRKITEFNEANHNWTVEVSAPVDFGLSYLRWSPFFVLALGAALSFAVMASLLKSDRLTLRLKSAREEAEKANQAKSLFLANISHEIRTPLGVIIGFAESAMKEDQKPQRDSYLKTILRNGNELARIIGDVLDLSKIEAKTLLIEKKSFSLKKLNEEMREIWHAQAISKGLRFQFEMSELPEFIQTDKTRMKQILVNLLSNALKFTGEGLIDVKVQEIAGDLVYTIDDTGIGIREENKKKLFKAFSQEDSSITRKFGGSGLGLAISKELAHALGGDVSVESNPKGRGSRFVFRIPLVSVPSLNVVQQNAVADEEVLKGKKILLVEDSPDNQDLIDLILKDSGVILTIANNGLEGVEAASRSAFDLILMDIQMPVLDGYGAFAELKARKSKVPVIALTAHALKEEMDKALERGFAAYLTKPIDRAQLLQVSSQILASQYS